MFLPKTITLFVAFAQGLITDGILVRDLPLRSAHRVRSREHNGRVIEQIPLRGVPPILTRAVLGGDAGADRAQNDVDRFAIGTRGSCFVPELRVLGAIVLAGTNTVPERGNGVFFDKGVLQDELGESTPWFA